MLVLAILPGLAGCGRIVTVDTTTFVEDGEVAALLAKLPDATETATLYGQVLTAERKVALVLEGYTDEATMMALADLFAERGTDVVFFVSAQTVSEHENVVRYLADKGHEIGNYGMTGAKDMDGADDARNVRQLVRSQKELARAAGKAPSLARCNGSEYPERLLRVLRLCGLEGAVKPNLYLNHTSFQTPENALNTVRKMSRGTVISLKLGQALDENEFGSGKKLDERPAVDPPPTIEDAEPLAETEGRYENIVNVATWLLDALEAEEYEIVTPEKLEKARMTMDDEPAELDAETLAKLNPDAYLLPVTEAPLGVQEQSGLDTSSAFSSAVFIGDSVMVKVQAYVENARKSNPGYFQGAQFLAAGGLSVGNSLWQVSGESRHPAYQGKRMPLEDAVAAMGAKDVFIMLGMNDIAIYPRETYLQNYRMLIYLIRSQSPDARVHLLTITPAVASRNVEPTNRQIFDTNLALAKFALQYGYDLTDVAFAMRDASGALPNDYCSDPEAMGMHFTDKACKIWLNFVSTHVR